MICVRDSRTDEWMDGFQNITYHSKHTISFYHFGIDSHRFVIKKRSETLFRSYSLRAKIILKWLIQQDAEMNWSSEDPYRTNTWQCFFSLFQYNLQKISALRAEFLIAIIDCVCGLFAFVRAQREKFPFIRCVTRFSLSSEPRWIFGKYFQIRRRTIYGTKKTLTPEFSYVSDRVKYLVCAFPIVLESLWAVSERFIHYFSMVWAWPKICFDFQISDRRVDGWTQIIPP